MSVSVRLGVFLVGWLAAALAFAESGGAVPRYTLQDCLRISRERSSRPAQARRDVESARAQVRQTRSQALPHLDLKGGYTRLDEVPSMDLGGTVTTLGSEDNYNASAELSQLLYNGGQVNAALRAAKAFERSALWGVSRADETLERDVAIGFNDVLLARAQVDVEAESVDQLRRFVSQTEARYAQQTASEFDLLTARVRLANALPRLMAAGNQLEVARERFRDLVRLDEGGFELVGDPEQQGAIASLEDWLAKAEAGRPELNQMEQLVRLKEEQLRAVKGEYQPTLRAFANYGGANSSQYDPTQAEWGWHWTAGLTVHWNLIDGGQQSGRVLETRLSLDQARSDLTDLRRAIRLEVRQAYLDLTHAREVLTVAKDTVGLAERGFAIARTRYEQGVSTYLEFMETNLALSTARLQLCLALRDQAVAGARIRCASGLPIGD
jgi:outer membrane protein